MSDLAAAAAKIGVPEAIVRRSAEARAEATGTSVDEVLAAWAGGASLPTESATTPPVTSPQPPAASEEPTTSIEQPAASEQPAEASAVATVAATTDARPEAGSRTLEAGDSPPLLIGRNERMGLTLTGSVGLFVLSVLLGFFLPSLPQSSDVVRSSNHAYSRAARNGQEIYLQEGCGTCHTQLVRSVVPDANLGPVTLDDTNQVIGSRRIGPDLAAFGDRILDTEALMALLNGEGNHPTVSLSDTELADLIAYLRESR